MCSPAHQSVVSTFREQTHFHLVCYIMLDEKELATRPIVQESVQHNARVSSPFGNHRLSPQYLRVIFLVPCQATANMHLATDGLEYPRSHSLLVRGSRRYTWSGILAWLHLLLLGYGCCFRSHLRAQGGEQPQGLFLSAFRGPLGWRPVRRVDVIHPYVDLVLRAVQGVEVAFQVSRHVLIGWRRWHGMERPCAWETVGSLARRNSAGC